MFKCESSLKKERMNFTGGLLIIVFIDRQRWFITPLMQWDLIIKDRPFQSLRDT